MDFRPKLLTKLVEEEPFAACGGAKNSSVFSASGSKAEPFPEYEDVVYTRDTDKKIDDYGGEKKVVQEVEQTTCPACGAMMSFDPTTSALKCNYCGHLVKVVASAAMERELKLGEDTAQKWHEDTRVFRCGKCGATSVFAKSEFSMACPFCGSPSVTNISDIEGVRPNAVVPFTINADKALESYRAWIRRRAYAPRLFKQGKKQTIRGVYIPSWTFDSFTYSQFSAVVGDYYMVTVGFGKNMHTERRIRYRNTSGAVQIPFDDILVESGRVIDAKSFAHICPFETKNAVEYHSAFLAGYSAEHYTTTLVEGWATAQEKMHTKIHATINQNLLRDADVVQKINFSTNYASNRFKYILLPVYVCHQEFKEKNYQIFLNGASGKIVGKYPKSKLKVFWTVLGALVAIAGVVVGTLFGMGII